MDMLNQKQAAELFGTSVVTFRLMVELGQVPFRWVGKRKMFNPKVIQAIKEGKQNVRTGTTALASGGRGRRRADRK